jgi:hypothetical protein
MSYLFPDASKTELGVVQVGVNIDVDANSVISISQSVATTASITFANVTDSALTSGRVTFAGTGGLLTDDADFTFNTTTNTLSIANVNVVNTLTLNGASVITSVTPSAGPGISVTAVTTSGPAAAFTVNNTGVTSIVAGTNISINTSTGAVTINAAAEGILQTVGTGTAYTALATDEYIGVTANPTTITLPTGVTGKTYIVKNESTGNTTVTGTGGQLLDTTASKTLGSKASISVVFRAGAWRII